MSSISPWLAKSYPYGLDQNERRDCSAPSPHWQYLIFRLLCPWEKTSTHSLWISRIFQLESASPATGLKQGHHHNGGPLPTWCAQSVVEDLQSLSLRHVGSGMGSFGSPPMGSYPNGSPLTHKVYRLPFRVIWLAPKAFPPTRPPVKPAYDGNYCSRSCNFIEWQL